MINSKKIFVAGQNGMVGSSILKFMKSKRSSNKFINAGRNDVDFLNKIEVDHFYNINRPNICIIAAAKVGGIFANNNYPADFIYENLMIQNHLIHGAYLIGVNKLLFLGSSCIYPREAEQPIKENALLSGYLEKTNEPYAISKIAGIKMCQSYRRQYGCDFISAMPTNLYGPGDNYNIENSHVIPALIFKTHEAKIKDKDYLTIWGTGKPKREFLFVDDLAEACTHLLENYSDVMPVNIGSGEEIEIGELANLISKVVGFNGKIKYDNSKPDGTPRKILDTTKLENLGWKFKTSLEHGLKKTYKSFLKNYLTLRR